MILDKIIHHFYRFMILKKWLFIIHKNHSSGGHIMTTCPYEYIIWIINCICLFATRRIYICLINYITYLFSIKHDRAKMINEFWHNKIHHHRQVRIYIAYMCNLIAKVPLNYGGVAFCLGSVIWDYTIWLLFIPML